MASLNVLPVNSQSEDGFWDVISRTYNNGEPIPEEQKAKRPNGKFAALRDGHVVGGFRVLEFEIALGTSRAKCNGVAAVAVAPEARGGGVGSEMMRACIRNAFETGVAFTSLYAFRETFYRKFGYEVCGRRTRLTVPTHRVVARNSDLPIRVLTPRDFAELEPTYLAFAESRAGMVIRTPDEWQRVLGENKDLTIYAAGDPVQAYVAVRHAVEFWVEQSFSEVVWSTQEGYDAILGVMRTIGINKTALAWHEPSDSPYAAQYLDQGVNVAIDRPIMYRACDVEKALQTLTPAGEGEARLSIEDDVVGENSGTWVVRWADGKVGVERGSGPATKLSIQQFTQVIMGEPSYADLARNGVVETNANLGRLLPSRPVYCNDFF